MISNKPIVLFLVVFVAAAFMLAVAVASLDPGLCGNSKIDSDWSTVYGLETEECDDGGWCANEERCSVAGSACDDGSICTKKSGDGCSDTCKNEDESTKVTVVCTCTDTDGPATGGVDGISGSEIIKPGTLIVTCDMAGTEKTLTAKDTCNPDGTVKEYQCRYQENSETMWPLYATFETRAQALLDAMEFSDEGWCGSLGADYKCVENEAGIGYCKESKAECGNGVKEEDEACDDGNTETEKCDYGLTSCTVCSSACQSVPGETSYCADNKLDTAHEGCDDGNTVTESCAYGETACQVCGPACQYVTGKLSYCGDASVDTENGEDCDQGTQNSNTGSCNTQCKKTACGDGILQAPNGFGQSEDCDDGNTVSGDGCSSICQKEVKASPNCGDGNLDAGEECDQGSANSNTGTCNVYCKLTTCGDGIKQAVNGKGEAEQCDDGNQVELDGCSSECQKESCVDEDESDSLYTKGKVSVISRKGILDTKWDYCNAESQVVDYYCRDPPQAGNLLIIPKPRPCPADSKCDLGKCVATKEKAKEGELGEKPTEPYVPPEKPKGCTEKDECRSDFDCPPGKECVNCKCIKIAFCGDKVLDPGEECDEGPAGSESCTMDCKKRTKDAGCCKITYKDNTPVKKGMSNEFDCKEKNKDPNVAVAEYYGNNRRCEDEFSFQFDKVDGKFVNYKYGEVKKGDSETTTEENKDKSKSTEEGRETATKENKVDIVCEVQATVWDMDVEGPEPSKAEFEILKDGESVDKIKAKCESTTKKIQNPNTVKCSIKGSYDVSVIENSVCLVSLEYKAKSKHTNREKKLELSAFGRVSLESEEKVES